MSKLTKNQKAVKEKIDSTKLYGLDEACALLKEISYTKFDASVEITTNLGVDPRKANQMIRGVVSLPNGTGKVTRVLVLCTPDKENEAKEAGADYVGLDEYIEKIKGGWTDIDSFRNGKGRPDRSYPRSSWTHAEPQNRHRHHGHRQCSQGSQGRKDRLQGRQDRNYSCRYRQGLLRSREDR